MNNLKRTTVLLVTTLVPMLCLGQNGKTTTQKATDFATGQVIKAGTKYVVGTAAGAGAIAGGVAGGLLAPNTSIPDSEQEAAMGRQLRKENMEKYGKPYFDPPQND